MTRRKRTRKKKNQRSWWPLITLINLLVLGTLAGYVMTRQISWPLTSKPTQLIPVIESLLLASDIHLNDDLETYDASGGVPHWKVHVDSGQKGHLLKAFQHLKNQWQIKVGTEKQIKGQDLQLVTFSSEGRILMKLILAEKHVYVPEPVAPLPEPSAETRPPEDYWESYQGPQIAIIIDDVGMKPVTAIQDLIDLQVPITFAVLPFQRFSTSSADQLDSEHYEVMLHMPMEPTNFPVTNPGAGAIFSSFSRAKTQAALIDALDTVPHVRGVNNHMGSKITASTDHMEMIMDILKERGLFFVDSRTHASTVAFDVARSNRVKSAKRDVFLDATMSYDFTRQQLIETASVARENGFAIAIGHPYPSTIAAMVDLMPDLKDQGFSFVFASQLARAGGG